MPYFDPENYRCCPNVTVHQLFDVLGDDPHCDIRDYLQTLAAEGEGMGGGGSGGGRGNR